MEVTQGPSTEERMDKIWHVLYTEMVFSLQRKEGRVMSHAYDPELWKLRQEK